MKTVAIYQKTENGNIRLGVFTPRKYYSIRAISEQFMAKHPDADPSTLFISFRRIVMGRYADTELIPFDLSKDAQ